MGRMEQLVLNALLEPLQKKGVLNVIHVLMDLTRSLARKIAPNVPLAPMRSIELHALHARQARLLERERTIYPSALCVQLGPILLFLFDKPGVGNARQELLNLTELLV